MILQIFVQACPPGRTCQPEYLMLGFAALLFAAAAYGFWTIWPRGK